MSLPPRVVQLAPTSATSVDLPRSTRPGRRVFQMSRKEMQILRPKTPRHCSDAGSSVDRVADHMPAVAGVKNPDRHPATSGRAACRDGSRVSIPFRPGLTASLRRPLRVGGVRATPVLSRRPDLQVGGALHCMRRTREPQDWASICSAARHASMMVGALVLPEVMEGNTEASTTRSASMPCTRSCASTTESRASGPIAHVPTGW